MQARAQRGAHYWVEGEHLLCQPIGSRQVWGVSLKSLRKQRQASGYPHGLSAVVRPMDRAAIIGVKTRRQRAKEKGKEKVEGPPLKRRKVVGPPFEPEKGAELEEEEEEGPSLAPSLMERIADLPPEMVEHILRQMREPTYETRRFLLGELRVGSPLAYMMGSVRMMREFWAVSTKLSQDEANHLALSADAYTPLEFARLWYPIFLDTWDEFLVFDIYLLADIAHDRVETDALTGSTRNNQAVVAHMRPQPFFAYRSFLALEYVRLEAEIRRSIKAARQAGFPIGGGGIGNFSYLVRIALEELAIEIDRPEGLSLAEFDAADPADEEAVKAMEPIEEYREEVASPIVDIAIEAIRVIRQRPPPMGLRPSDYVLLGHLVYLTTMANSLSSAPESVITSLQNATFAGILVWRIRKYVYDDILKPNDIEPWWPVGERPSWGK